MEQLKKEEANFVRGGGLTGSVYSVFFTIN